MRREDESADVRDLKQALLSFVISEVRDHALELGPLSADIQKKIAEGVTVAVEPILKRFEERRASMLVQELEPILRAEIKAGMAGARGGQEQSDAFGKYIQNATNHLKNTAAETFRREIHAALPALTAAVNARTGVGGGEFANPVPLTRELDDAGEPVPEFDNAPIREKARLGFSKRTVTRALPIIVVVLILVIGAATVWRLMPRPSDDPELLAVEEARASAASMLSTSRQLSVQASSAEALMPLFARSSQEAAVRRIVREARGDAQAASTLGHDLELNAEVASALRQQTLETTTAADIRGRQADFGAAVVRNEKDLAELDQAVQRQTEKLADLVAAIRTRSAAATATARAVRDDLQRQRTEAVGQSPPQNLSEAERRDAAERLAALVAETGKRIQTVDRLLAEVPSDAELDGILARRDMRAARAAFARVLRLDQAANGDPS